MDVGVLLLGVVFAVYGAHLLVDGASAVAKRFNIPTVVIGSTIVAFGTSMPEFTVNVSSALSGNTDLALGNVLGSNLFNICAIVGIVCLLSPIKVGSDIATKDLPMCLMSAVLLGVCGNQIYIDHINYHQLFPSTGIVFLCFFLIFMRYVYGEAAAADSHHHIAKKSGLSSEEDSGPHSTAKSVLFIILGLAGLVAGGECIVDGATGVARSFDISERVIGLLIVGPGTSAPELIASIVAALKKDVGMVMGNALGSNIFNIFLTLGVTALIQPIPLDLALNTVVLVNIAATALLAIYVASSKEKVLGRGVGVLMLAIYSGYIFHSLASG